MGCLRGAKPLLNSSPSLGEGEEGDMVRQRSNLGDCTMNELKATINQMEDNALAPDYCRKGTVVMGCGNSLFGDDGFGPAVVDYLESHYQVPDDVAVLDVGTGIRELLFNIILSECRPKRLVILDALDCGRTPGEIFNVNIEDIPAAKISDFSVHLLPTINMLKELRDLCGVDVVVLAVQPQLIPESVTVGLSPCVEKAVAAVAGQIASSYFSR